MTTESLSIRFVGDPVGADLLVFFLRGQGLQVDSEPPRDEQAFQGEASVTEIVTVSSDLAECLTPAAIKTAAQKAIDKVTQQTPRVEIQIEDDENT